MNINKVGEISIQSPSPNGKKDVEKKRAESTTMDSAELTPEAQALYEAAQSKKLQQVMERLNSGFYNQKAVIQKVATRILGDLDESR